MKCKIEIILYDESSISQSAHVFEDVGEGTADDLASLLKQVLLGLGYADKTVNEIINSE